MEAGTLHRRDAAARPVLASREIVGAALIALTAVALALRFAAFSGVPANPYYDAAVRSMGLSWHNFFFGAYEPGGQVSIDKTPVDLWLQVLSVKVLGFSSVALRVPEALAGALAVPLLYDLVRRLFGRGAGLAAAAALAVLPVAVLTARSDTMDSVMMALLVAAGWLVVSAAQRRQGWPVVAAGAVTGLAFNVKLFEALVALPALALLALLAADLPLRRRLAHLAGAAVSFVLVSLSWVSVAGLFPLGSRPYPIGSTNGGVWNVVFAFNGIDRLRNGPTRAVAALDPAGPVRLLTTTGRHFGPLIGVLLIPAFVLGALAVADAWCGCGGRRASADRDSRLRRAGAVYVATWLLTGYALFSAMGRLQVRYLEAMTPAVAAAAGVGLAALATAAWSRSWVSERPSRRLGCDRAGNPACPEVAGTWGVYVALGLQDSPGTDGQPGDALVDEVAALPPRGELLVEGHEPLELKAAVRSSEQPSRGRRGARGRGGRIHQVSEACEVQADRVQTPPAGVGDGGDDERLGQAVGRLAHAAHDVEREPVADVGKPQEGAERTGRIAPEDIEAALVFGRAPEPSEGHREARQPGLPRTPTLVDRVQLGHGGGVEVGPGHRGDLPAEALLAVDRLAHGLHRAALEGEGRRVDDGLLADADGAEAKSAVRDKMAVARAGEHDVPAMAVRLGHEALEDGSRCSVGADRVGGDDRRPAQDPVGEQAAVGEVKRLVGAQRKGVQ